jgi:hypothetical protein
VRRTVPPSAEIEAQIDQLLAMGVGENPRESLSELARLGARLIIQRAVEDEFDAWLGRARYERRPAYQRGLRNDESGLRNGFRPRTVQTAEGELEIEVPQVREAAETFASKLFPRGTKLVRTEPLKALVIGAFVRGLSMRDVESLCEKAGLGKLSRSTVSRVCEELRERYEAFKRRDLYDLNLVGLFLDATYLAVRPDGPKEGVLVAWGFTEDGERVLLSVMLGMLGCLYRGVGEGVLNVRHGVAPFAAGRDLEYSGICRPFRRTAPQPISRHPAGIIAAGPRIVSISSRWDDDCSHMGGWRVARQVFWVSMILIRPHCLWRPRSRARCVVSCASAVPIRAPASASAG